MSTPSITMGPARGGFSITPSAIELQEETRGLYVGQAGSVTVVMASGETVTFGNMVAGVIHPIRCLKVTSATASGIVGLY